MIVVSRAFLLGLTSFLRQAALSLDRISPHDLSPLNDFYRRASTHSPQDVLAKLEEVNSGRGHEARFQTANNLSLSLVSDLGLTAFKVLLCREAIIRDPRLWFAQQSIRNLEKLLADKECWRQEVINEVRMELFNAASMLEPKIYPKSVRKKTERVIHLNHAEHLKLATVDEIAGDRWL